MTVLKSREILSTPKPRNVVAEPVTPPKTSEISNQSLSPSQNLGDPEIGFDVGAGSIMVSESGSVRRVSARLARKVGENVEVVSGKRKKVEGSSSSCVDIMNLRGWDSDVKLGVESSGGIGNPDTNIVCEVLQDLGDGGVTELVKDSEKLMDIVSAAKLGFGCDIDTSVRDTEDNGRRKRRFSMEVNALGCESSEKDKVEKGFLSLRSGKRVVKRQINEENSEESSAVFSGDVPVKSLSLAKSSGSEEVVKDKISPVRKPDLRTRGRLSTEGKRKMKMEVETSLVRGKMKLDAGASSSFGINTVKVENANGSSVSGVDHSVSDEVLPPDEVQIRGTNLSVSDSDARTVYRERFRNIARRNASRFAHFSAQDELSGNAHDDAGTDITSSNGIEDWPGPFSTARKIIKDRETNRNGERRGVSTDKSKAVELKWIPKSHESCKHQKQVPSLQSICLSILSENADAITSLDFVPDALRHKICWSLCDSRRMDGHFLELLVHGTPTEVRIRDCSWLSEELFDKIFKGCNTCKLTVLQLDQGGVCIPDYILCSALARSPNSLPALTTISLKGAYRLSDAGLSMLASAAPSLKSIDISQCPLLTSEGICCLVSPLRLVLRELYIDYCHGIDAMLILPDLQKLESLEVLSVAGIPTVCDDFVSEFVSAHGSRMKELVLADCMLVSDDDIDVYIFRLILKHLKN